MFRFQTLINPFIDRYGIHLCESRWVTHNVVPSREEDRYKCPTRYTGKMTSPEMHVIRGSNSSEITWKQINSCEQNAYLHGNLDNVYRFNIFHHEIQVSTSVWNSYEFLVTKGEFYVNLFTCEFSFPHFSGKIHLPDFTWIHLKICFLKDYMQIQH